MVVCVDGGGYYRYAWKCACCSRSLLAYFSLDVLFFSGVLLLLLLLFVCFVFPFVCYFIFICLFFVISSISHLSDVWCFAVFILLLKEVSHGDNKVVLYCTVL